MNKLYLNYLLILFVPFLIIIGCSTDDEIIESTQKIEEKNTFAIFSQSSNIQRKTSSPSVDYANGFSILMQRYDSIHDTNISGLINTPNVVEHKKKSYQNIIVENKDFYIETRLHSQTIFDENGDIWVMYPRIKNNFVDGLLIARYADNGTNVFFSYVKKDSELYVTNIKLFQENFDKQINNSINKKANGNNCGFEGLDSCDLELVVITPKPRPESCPLCQTSMPENPNGGCSQFEECLYNDPSGGGGGDNGYDYTFDNNIITDKLDECSSEIFNNIKNQQSISNVIKKFDGGSAKFNWTLSTVPGANFDNKLATTDWLNKNANNYITEISEDYTNNASKLSIARTIIHEALHAYILSYLDSEDPSLMKKDMSELLKDMINKKYGDPNENLEKYHHEEIANNYINTVASTLALWDNNNQNFQYYIDLAWGGLIETDSFKNNNKLSSEDKKRISDRNLAEDKYTSNSVSEKCSK